MTSGTSPAIGQRRQVAAFVPRVDVYYCGENAPEKAIVKVELPGIELDAVNLEVAGGPS